jgi:hypothetical protein
MPRTDEVKRLIRAVGDNPQVLRRLIRAQGRDEKRRVLEETGILPRDQPELDPREIAEEMERILRDAGFDGELNIKAPTSRVVEWVAAIGTAAAGALAAL